MKYGTKVKVLRSEHHGKTGKITGCMASLNLYVVKLDDGREIAVEPENLQETRDIKTVKLELTEDEFEAILNKIGWMSCFIRDTNLNYKDYCNGKCNGECNRPEMRDVSGWMRSKIVEE